MIRRTSSRVAWLPLGSLFGGLLFTFFLLHGAQIAATTAAPFMLTDDFSSYQDGTDGQPRWFTTSIAWSVKEGSLVGSDARKTFALVEEAPFGLVQRIEATVELHGTTTSDWKVAGLTVFVDEQNYWHFALVEAPDEEGNEHFLELREMYQGNWIAEHAPATKLTQVFSTNMDLDWSYNHTYRLRMELSRDSIRGSLEDVNGSVLASCGFSFDNEAVTYGRAGLDAGGFIARFDEFRLEVDETFEPSKKIYPPFGVSGWSGIRSTPSGFFTTEKRGATWWLIDPTGKGFFIIGTDHANYNVHWCEQLGYAPYHKNCEEKYGGIEAWSESTANRLLSWGFNTLAAGHSPSLRYRGLAHIEFLGLGTDFASMEDICPRTTWTGFPDVFSPSFSRYCDKVAKMRCEPNRDDPWLIGYFIDNELEWYGKSGEDWGLLAETIRKGPTHPAKIRLLELLRERYRTVQDLNQAWGLDLREFEDFLSLQYVRMGTRAIQEDAKEFMNIVAEQYFQVTASAIRKYDPNHLVLGCRFAGRAPDPAWEIAGKYCDVVSVNCYRNVSLEKGVVEEGFEEDLRRWYSLAKKPLMITEWSFPALDAGLPCQHGAGQRVATQADRARAFSIFQKFLFSMPFIVGSDFFMWVDEPGLGISSTFPEDSNYGLVNEQDEPYAMLTRAASRLNPQVYRIHSGKMPVTMALFGLILVALAGAAVVWHLWVVRGKDIGKRRVEGRVKPESCTLTSYGKECDLCTSYTVKDGRDYCRLKRRYLS